MEELLAFLSNPPDWFVILCIVYIGIWGTVKLIGIVLRIVELRYRRRREERLPGNTPREESRRELEEARDELDLQIREGSPQDAAEAAQEADQARRHLLQQIQAGPEVTYNRIRRQIEERAARSEQLAQRRAELEVRRAEQQMQRQMRHVERQVERAEAQMRRQIEHAERQMQQTENNLRSNIEIGGMTAEQMGQIIERMSRDMRDRSIRIDRETASRIDMEAADRTQSNPVKAKPKPKSEELPPKRLDLLLDNDDE